MGLGIPPLKINMMLESNPLKSTMLVGRLGVLSTSNVCLELLMSRDAVTISPRGIVSRVSHGCWNNMER